MWKHRAQFGFDIIGRGKRGLEGGASFLIPALLAGGLFVVIRSFHMVESSSFHSVRLLTPDADGEETEVFSAGDGLCSRVIFLEER